MRKKKLWKSMLAMFTCSALMISIPANAAENTNEQKLKDGSYAYFEDKGITDAIDALDNSKYASLTVKGDEKDATSFKNMLDTIQWIKECNKLREQEGLEPLLVNDTLMAMAQADANYSDTVIGHAQQFSIGENCAWNFGSNPFTQWYDQEKIEYEKNPVWSNDTGHYLNIINANYKTTGFAINTRGTKYPYTYVQVFDYSDDGIPVEEYEAQLLEYYNSLKSDVNEPETNEPVTNEPATNEPATNEPATNEPATNEPATNEPATNEPATNEPVNGSSNTNEPGADRPTNAPSDTNNPTVDNNEASVVDVTVSKEDAEALEKSAELNGLESAGIQAGTKLKVSVIEKQASIYQSIADCVAGLGAGYDKTKAAAADLSLVDMNGAEIKQQPDKKINVTLALFKNLEGAKYVEIFRYNADTKKLDHVDYSEVKNGKFSFETDHFTPYVFVAIDKLPDSQTATTTAEAPTTTKAAAISDKPKTGDTAPYAVFAVLGAAGLAGFITAAAKRKHT